MARKKTTARKRATTAARKPPQMFRESYTSGAITGPALSKYLTPLNPKIMQLCENAYLKEPLTRKGILKRSHDVFERWLDIVSDDERVPDIFEDLATRVDLKNRLIDLLKNAMVYGPAYAEIVFEGDDTPASQPPKEGLHIAAVELIGPKTIKPVWDDDPTSETYGQLLYFEQDPAAPSIKPVKLHPSRVVYFAYDTLGDGRRPVGVVEPMLHVIESKITLDKVAGRIPKKVLSQVILAKIEGATQEELDAWAEALKNMSEVGLFVGTEAHDIKVESTGKALDIKAYSEHLIYQIAGGVGVPYTVLLGAGAGTISTSETNLKDYYSDLRDLQVRFTPIIRRLLDIELRAEGIEADYNVKWREIYANEQAEADILLTRARAIDLLINDGVITPDEAREFLGLPELQKSEERRVGPPVRGNWYEG